MDRMLYEIVSIGEFGLKIPTLFYWIKRRIMWKRDKRKFVMYIDNGKTFTHVIVREDRIYIRKYRSLPYRDSG